MEQHHARCLTPQLTVIIDEDKMLKSTTHLVKDHILVFKYRLIVSVQLFSY